MYTKTPETVKTEAARRTAVQPNAPERVHGKDRQPCKTRQNAPHDKAFAPVKDGFRHCKRPSFTQQKAAFYAPADGYRMHTQAQPACKEMAYKPLALHTFPCDIYADTVLFFKKRHPGASRKINMQAKSTFRQTHVKHAAIGTTAAGRPPQAPPEATPRHSPHPNHGCRRSPCQAQSAPRR